MRRFSVNLLIGVVLALLQAPAASGEAAPTDTFVLFRSTEGGVWVATLQSSGLTNETRLAIPKGETSNLALAPGGNAVAYTRHDARYDRWVEIVDRATGRVTRLSAIPTQTSYGPEWSGDGRMLAVNTFDWKRWNIALVTPDNTGYSPLDSSKAEGCMSPSWAPSGQWLCCVGQAVWKLGADGSTSRVFDAEGKISKVVLTIPRRCSVSADDKTIVFEEVLSDHRVPNEGLLRALFSVRTSGEDVRRVGPANFWASEPRFVDERRFLFLGFSLDQNRSLLAKRHWPATNLYLGSLDSPDALLLRTRVREFSVAKRGASPANPGVEPDGP
jgi:hypothetical protein